MYFNRHLWYVREAKLEGREEKKYINIINVYECE